MLGATTGLRAADIARLKLTDIDWTRGEIHVSQSKTGGMLYLPLLQATGKYTSSPVRGFVPLLFGISSGFGR